MVNQTRSLNMATAAGCLLPLGGQHLGEVDDTLRVSPLVIVPGDNLNHICVGGGDFE